jgi:hypothetical protein
VGTQTDIERWLGERGHRPMEFEYGDTTMARPKLPQQGSTIPLNPQEVWDEFIANSHWDKADVEAEKAALASQREKLLDQKSVIDAKLATIDDQISTLGSRYDLAKKHLDEMMKRLGGFATRKVLLAALQERFPPARVLKTGEQPRNTADTWEPSEDQLNAILEHLDSEGMTMYQLKKQLANTPAAELDSKQISLVLKRLIRKGLVKRTGERRSTEYSLSDKSESAD